MSPRITTTFAVAALTVMVLACGTESIERHEPTTRDSAGVLIVENAGGTWLPDEAWSLSDDPILQIGTVDGPEGYQMFQVTDATILSNGTIVVANAGSFELRYYTQDGQFQAKAGQQGGGPGEFERLGWLRRLAGDTIAAGDTRHNRVHFFDGDGAFVDAVTPRTAEGTVNLLGMLTDGTILATRTGGIDPNNSGKLTRVDQALFRFSPGAADADSIGMFPGREMLLQISPQSIQILSPAFMHSTRIVAFGTKIIVARTDDFIWQVYQNDIHPVRSVRFNRAAIPITDQLLNEFIEYRASQAPEGAREGLRKNYSEIPHPKNVPTFGDIVVDETQHVWIADYSITDTNTAWNVFSPDGWYLGVVRTNPGLDPLYIGSDKLVGVVKDDLGVERVQVFSILRP